MSKRVYQLIQERYGAGGDYPTRDEFPFLFATVEECQARVKRDGLKVMFEHKGDTHYIAELRYVGKDRCEFTGRTFELEPPLTGQT